MHFIVFVLNLCLLLTESGSTVSPWRSLAPGMDLGRFAASRPSTFGDSYITVLRIDPDLWDLHFVGISQNGESSLRTAKEWSKAHQLSAVINAGMFRADYRTHIGYLRFREHINNSNVNKYQSVAAFDPRHDGLPRFQIFDLDSPGVTIETILGDYASVVQNLRLIKRPGLNRWRQQEKMWSEAALGEDDAGRILFIFCRSPFTMHDLNQELLRAGIGLVSAHHLEGGPEAQLYVRVGDVELEVYGSYETSFRENDDNAAPWRVPNVLGVRPREPVANKMQADRALPGR